MEIKKKNALEKDLEEQFSLPRNTAALRTENYKRYINILLLLLLLLLLLQVKLRRNFNPDHNKFSSQSKTAVVTDSAAKNCGNDIILDGSNFSRKWKPKCQSLDASYSFLSLS